EAALTEVRVDFHVEFCLGWVALQQLPSFPTRRSSDLVRRAHRVPGGSDVLAHATADEEMRKRDQGRGVRDVGDARRFGSGHRRKDRKSTRLNSSHSQISYAVFCLKKKRTR